MQPEVSQVGPGGLTELLLAGMYLSVGREDQV